MRASILFALLCTLLLAGRSAASADEPAAEASGDATYYLSMTLPLDLPAAKAAVTEALKIQSFAVLTEIDLQAKFKEKLGKDIPGYVILGACGAGFAGKAWDIDPHVGVLLPCNIVLREIDAASTEVLIRDPRGLEMANHELAGVGTEVYAKMRAVMADLEDR